MQTTAVFCNSLHPTAPVRSC